MDPNIRALKRRGFTNQGSTLYLWAMGVFVDIRCGGT